MWNEPRLYGFFPEKKLFPESGDFRLPPGFLPSAEARPLTEADVLALSGFAAGKQNTACVPFESDEFDPCVILMKRTDAGIFVLRLRSADSMRNKEKLGRLTDLMIALVSVKRTARDAASPFFLPEEARESFCNYFGNGKEAVTAREVSLFCSTTAALQCVMPVFRGSIDSDIPIVPERDTCKFWEYYLTCLSVMLRAAKKSENRVLTVASGFESGDGHFFFSFSTGGEKNTARSLARTAEKLRERFPAGAGGFLSESGWRVETAYRAGTVTMTLHAIPHVGPTMHTPLPVTLYPEYLSSLLAFAEVIGKFM